MDHFTDHADRAVARLAEQLKGQPNVEGWIRALVGEVQAIEDAAFDVFSLRSLDTASGEQLDGIGRIVGQPRLGLNDATYLLRLKAKIAINLSSGTIPDLLKILALIQPGTVMTLTEYFPAGLSVVCTNAVPTSTATILAEALHTAKAAAVHANLEWTTVSDASTFSFSSGPGLGFGDSTTPATGGAFSGAL